MLLHDLPQSFLESIPMFNDDQKGSCLKNSKQIQIHKYLYRDEFGWKKSSDGKLFWGAGGLFH